MSDFPPDENATHSRIESEAADAAAHRGQHELDLNGLRSSTGPQFVPHVIIDMVSLAKVQASFIQAQTDFLMQQFAYGTQEYTDALMKYSRAQTDMLRAQSVALKQAGIV
jgi:hypothetical protein